MLANLRLERGRARGKIEIDKGIILGMGEVRTLSGIPGPMFLLLMDKLDTRVGEESNYILRLCELFLLPYTCVVKMCTEWNSNIFYLFS